LLGEILTWVGVAVTALVTFALYRSAERAQFPHDPKKPVDE
jgi:hypothetical protein